LQLGSGGTSLNVVPKKILQYVEFTKKLLLEVEEQECINEQIKQDILLKSLLVI
jgi:hypothetical protein